MNIFWDESKNEWLKNTRYICFEQIVEKIVTEDFVGPEENPARIGQYRIIVKINDYPYVVPLVIDEEGNWFFEDSVS